MALKEYKSGTASNGVIGRTFGVSSPAWPEPLRAKDGAPNVLFIVQDDMGSVQLHEGLKPGEESGERASGETARTLQRLWLTYCVAAALGAVILVFVLAGCSTSAPGGASQRRDLATIKAEQAALTPGQVLESLRKGNERFASGKIAPRDMLHDQRITAAGQYPHAIILSCIDSRAPAEIIFDAGLGDLFNARIAGNIADPDLVGSMEYACAVAGSKLVLVMGHTSCGAIKGACDRVELGNLTGLLKKIEPAIASVRDVPGERNSKNTAFVEAVSEANARLTVERIRELSPILRELESTGKIQIVGSIYDLDTGRVRFLPQEQR